MIKIRIGGTQLGLGGPLRGLRGIKRARWLAYMDDKNDEDGEIDIKMLRMLRIVPGSYGKNGANWPPEKLRNKPKTIAF